ncbi:hypothetical protein Btru_053884 [Bulinus truncatus]|nr:hypothetical protein Btru_053884 [Bulinus truncatus]
MYGEWMNAQELRQMSQRDVSVKSSASYLKEECQLDCSQNKVDIALLIDSSASISTEANFNLGLAFIKDFLYKLSISPRHTRVAAAMYGDGVYKESAFDFNKYGNKGELLDAVCRLRWMHGTETNTGKGINYMVRNFLPRMRPDAAKVRIVITDGQSQDQKATAAAAKTARDRGITMFAVGIGQLVKDRLYHRYGRLDLYELENIAGSPSRVLTVGDYSKLNSILKDLIKKYCYCVYRQLPVDIALLIDSTASIGSQKNFTLGIEFIQEILKDFDMRANLTRVGAVIYERDKVDTFRALTNLMWMRGSSTETGINYMVRNFLPLMRPTAAKVGVVITDGQSQDPKKTKQAAEDARMNNITMIAIGVGEPAKGRRHSKNGELDLEELKAIAGNETFVLTVSHYSKLGTIKNQLLNKFCIGISEYSSMSRPR